MNETITYYGIAGFLLLFIANRKNNDPDYIPVNNRVYDWVNEVYLASVRTNLNPNLILAVISQESQGNPNKPGLSGEIGLMQIKPDAAQDVGFSSPPTDPELNILAGAKYLRLKINEMGNIFDGLRAYNKGAKSAKGNENLGVHYANSVLNKKQEIDASGKGF